MAGKIRYLWQAFSALALFTLVACDSQHAPNPDKVVIDGSTVSVSLPQQLRTINDIDPAAVRAVVTINGVESELQRNGSGQYIGQIQVPAQSEFTVQIDFIELYSGEQLTLSRAQKSVTTGLSDTSLNLLPEDYDYSSFDFDGDGASNIQERNFNTSPLDSEQVPEFIEVEVFTIPPDILVDSGNNSYQIIATVGTETATVDANAGQLDHRFVVARNPNLTVNVRLVETSTGQGVTIGTQARQIESNQDSVRVTFNNASWNLEFDQDSDGVRDIDELIAGTDLLTAPVSNGFPYSIVFDIPAEITNTDSVFGTLEVDGQSISLSRMDNTYTGSSTAVAGSQVSLEAQIRDTYQGAPVVLATFSGGAQPVPNGSLLLEGFRTSLDEDGDGVLNYIEIAQGTDPFVAPVQCTPVTETIFATVTDDAYVNGTQITNNVRLQVDAGRRESLIRFQYDESLGEVTSATLSMTVGIDAGTGLLLVSAVSNFDWNDEAASVTVPSGELVGSAENDWERNETYAFSLDAAAISGDVTLIIRQQDGNDVAFQSSAAVAPELQLVVERCE